MPKPAIVRLAPVLRRQHGVVSVPQAKECDVDRRELQRMHTRGELERLYQGIYASVAWPDSWERRWVAAALYVGDATAISHAAAAYVHGLKHAGVGSRPLLELTTPRKTDVRVDGLRIHTATHLTAADVVIVRGLRVTSVPWTIAAMAHRRRVLATERTLDAAIADGLVTIESFAATALRFRCCPGMLVIREVLDRHLPAVRMSRSEGERVFFRCVVEDGLPEPVLNLRVVDDDGQRRYLDAAWPEWRVFAEIDLHPEHGRAIGRQRDGHRQNALVTGWTPLRFDEVDLRFGKAQVLADVRRALRAAGAPV